VSNYLKRIFTFVLLLTFCFYITPKEVLHVFTHHHDTEHVLVGGNHFEEQHHHCELLKIDQQFSAHKMDIPFYDFYVARLFYIIPNFSCYQFINNENINLPFSLRGPPAFVFKKLL
jgi:hypothetical protein